MIRFIDIRNQGTGERFAFWDTVRCEFIEIDFTEAWTHWEDLGLQKLKANFILRIQTICPDWVFDGKEDNLEDWIADDS